MLGVTPALFMASNAMPADMAPSPMTAMCWRCTPALREATAMPSAAEMDVEESRDPAFLAQPRHAGAASRQDLVRVGLVAHVPDDPVMRRVEHLMQRQRELDRAQVGRQVPARFGYRLQHEAAQFVRKLLQLATIQALEVCRGLNAPG
ncbi:hypothetical protein G6F65_017972 [Rhizopus arrhizus]|nr:hypothetical protein G6F65_017972 [Rhizopus arrhizus]